MFWFCGGHGQCAEGNGGEPGAGLDVGSILGSGGGDPRLDAASAAWLARYLKGDRSVKTGPGLRVPLGRRQVPRGASVPRRPAQARQGARLGHARDRPGRHLRDGDPGDGCRQRRARRAADGAQGLPAARPAEGHDHLPRHRRARRRADLRAARQRRTAAWWWATSRLPIPVRLDGRKHTVSRRLVPIASTAPAGARYTLQLVAGLGHLVTAAGHGHAQGVADRRGAAGGRSARPRARAGGAAARCAPSASGSPRAFAAGCWTDACSCAAAAWRACGGAGKGHVRFGRAAAGVQNLKLVLRLSDGTTVTRKRTILLCASER